MVLGGVHGNEPGGWLAADEVATWQPAAGFTTYGGANGFTKAERRSSQGWLLSASRPRPSCRDA